MEFLTSKGTLEKICQEQPINYRSKGITSLVFGTGLGGLGAMAGYFGYKTMKSIPDYSYTFDKIGVSLGLGLLAFFELTLIYGCLRCLADGITSLIDPHLRRAPDGNIYRRYDGFTANPSWFDKKFGDIVLPVDSVKDLDSVKEGLVFINGAKVEGTSYYSLKTKGKDDKIRDYWKEITIRKGEENRAVELARLAIVKFKVGDRYITARTRDSDLIEQLAKTQRDYNAHILLKYTTSSKGVVRKLIQMGNAYQR